MNFAFNNLSSDIYYYRSSIVAYCIDNEVDTHFLSLHFISPKSNRELFIDLSHDDSFNLSNILIVWLALLLYTWQLPLMKGSWFEPSKLAWKKESIKKRRQWGFYINLRRYNWHRCLSALVWQKIGGVSLHTRTMFISQTKTWRLEFPASYWLTSNSYLVEPVSQCFLSLLPLFRLRNWVLIIPFQHLSREQQNICIDQLRLNSLHPDYF